MSEERELLLKWIRRYVALMGLNDSYRESISLDDVYGETLSLLAQPEQEPLTGSEISQGFKADKDATNAESYWAGVALAEKHYGVDKK